MDIELAVDTAAVGDARLVVVDPLADDAVDDLGLLGGCVEIEAIVGDGDADLQLGVVIIDVGTELGIDGGMLHTGVVMLDVGINLSIDGDMLHTGVVGDEPLSLQIGGSPPGVGVPIQSAILEVVIAVGVAILGVVGAIGVDNRVILE